MIKLREKFQLGIRVTFSTNFDSAKFEHRGHRWPPFVAVKLIRRKRGRSSSSWRRRRSRERNAKGEASAISREKEWGSREESGVSEWDGHNFFFFLQKRKAQFALRMIFLSPLKPPPFFFSGFYFDKWHLARKRIQRLKNEIKSTS